MTTLLDLPSEILGQVLANLEYQDLVSALSICRPLHGFSDDQLLWREAFFHSFDDPRTAIASNYTKTAQDAYLTRLHDYDWKSNLKERIVALNALKGRDRPYDHCEDAAYEAFAESILEIIDTAKPTTEGPGFNSAILPQTAALSQEADALIRGTLKRKTPMFEDESSEPRSRSLSNLIRVDNWLWEPSPGHPMTRARAARQADMVMRSEAASRLHVLCGFTQGDLEDEKSAGRARRICYDWSLTNARNEYGPWKDDGTAATDWRRIEAIANVALRQCVYGSRRRFGLPQGFKYSIPHWVLTDPTVPEDWAGVQRKWIGTYVFMHWEDLLEYNDFRNTSARPTLEHLSEACGGLMRLNLKLDMDLKDDPKLNTKLPYCEDLPMLYFSGLSKSEDWQAANRIRGSCCLAPGGREVRWRYIVHYGGADQWQLEGVQPGGVKSGCIYGVWTSCWHEDTGPVGPFLYAPEELCDGPTSYVF